MADTTIKYLDLAGLGKYDALIKAHIKTADEAIDAKSIKCGATVGDTVYFFKTDAVPTKEVGDTTVVDTSKATFYFDISSSAVTSLNTRVGMNSTLNAYQSKENVTDIVNVLTGDNATAGSVAKAVKDAVEALDAEKSSAEVETGKGVQVTVKEVDGKIDSVTLTGDYSNAYDAKGAADAVSGTWAVSAEKKTVAEVQASIDSINNATTGILATAKKYTDDEIGKLDTAADVAIASVAEGVVTLKAGIKEENGIIAQGTGDDITLAKVATTGKAEDVSVEDAAGKITATTVEGALVEIATNVETNTNAIGKASTETETGTGLTKRVEDVEKAVGAGGSVATQIKNAIEALDATVTNQVAATDENPNPTQPDVIVSVTEADGKLTAVTATVSAERFDAYGAAKAVQGGDASYAGTVKSVDDKIGIQKATGVEATGLYKYVDDSIANADVSGKIATEINKLDVEDTAETGKFVTAVSETDGKITVSRAALVASDIPTLTLEKISDAGTAAKAAVATADITEESTDTGLVSAKQVAAFVKSEVADLEGAMHFMDAVTPAAEQSDEDAIKAWYTTKQTTPEKGDVFVITSNTKEYIVTAVAEDVPTIREIGDEGLYVKKSTKIAGIDLQEDITTADMVEALKLGSDYKIGTKDATIKAYIDSRIFVGTQDEVDAAKTAGTIDDTAFVVVTDTDAETLVPVTESEIQALFAPATTE